MTPVPEHEPELIRKAIQARAAKARLRSLADGSGSVPVRVVAQHDWSRRRAALFVALANATVQAAIALLR